MKTLEEIKNQHAQKRGFKDFRDFWTTALSHGFSDDEWGIDELLESVIKAKLEEAAESKDIKLLTSKKFENFNTSVTIHCPDEDSEMCITIKNRYKVHYSLTLLEAREMAEFIIAHANNEEQSIT